MKNTSFNIGEALGGYPKTARQSKTKQNKEKSEKPVTGARKMVQHLLLSEELSSVPSAYVRWHTTICNPASKDLMPVSGLLRYIPLTDTFTYTYMKRIIFKTYT